MNDDLYNFPTPQQKYAQWMSAGCPLIEPIKDANNTTVCWGYHGLPKTPMAGFFVRVDPSEFAMYNMPIEGMPQEMEVGV